MKVEVPDPVWTALRQEALDRRVTVKYLILEALATKGYAFDLSAIPKDGRVRGIGLIRDMDDIRARYVDYMQALLAGLARSKAVNYDEVIAARLAAT